MIIQPIPSGPFQTNAYIIADEATRQAVIIDPGVDAFSSIKDFLTEKQLIPTAIWLTHTHWDHTGDVAKTKEYFGIPASVHRLDKENLENPGSDGLPLMVDIPPATAEQLFEENDTLTVGNYSFRVIHTPGHTPGGVCFYNDETKTLISGDTLFKDSIGNLSFPTANSEAMWSSLEKLAKLPKETSVFPGHGPATTIAAEMRWLPRAREIFSD